ncbi:MAG: hydroxyethylthiazole kinase [Candidatus Mcinerneyibacterium aminivorans]|uniref:Hydroxyethylthiazole kinase n=1 Tax=Candidatus Mcinerneyibacterium aminivorans TaxID=2703815 RepID=A0A5D0MCF2_9BACT|nr:MAG: hydroxyethylthiazole kinase [Candidatus Mcinerneyibacterium aminivorans]
MKNIFNKIKTDKPLVHHITNYVTVNDCANTTLYWGGLPVMAHSKEEVDDMVELASSLVLNIGTLDKKQMEAMLKAGKKANELDIPVILDPVGVGATSYRTEMAVNLLNELDIAVISGNKGEITVLAGKKGQVKGVESVGKYNEIIKNSKALAQNSSSIVVVSGKEDIVTNGFQIYKIKNGSKLLGKVVGTGCMLTSTIGVFAGVSDDYFDSTIKAVVSYGIAGEISAEKSIGPASFKINFMDSIAAFNNEKYEKYNKIDNLS